jgi:hypothetical protein
MGIHDETLHPLIGYKVSSRTRMERFNQIRYQRYYRIRAAAGRRRQTNQPIAATVTTTVATPIIQPRRDDPLLSLFLSLGLSPLTTSLVSGTLEDVEDGDIDDDETVAEDPLVEADLALDDDNDDEGMNNGREGNGDFLSPRAITVDVDDVATIVDVDDCESCGSSSLPSSIIISPISPCSNNPGRDQCY